MQAFKIPLTGFRLYLILWLVILVSCNRVPGSNSVLVDEMKDTLNSGEISPQLISMD